MRTATPLLALALLALIGYSSVPRASTKEQACAIAKDRFAQASGFPKTRIALCDHIEAANSLPGYFVMALHSDRECDGICSTNLGWFAVQKSTGEVFEWDVAESKLGQPVRSRP